MTRSSFRLLLVAGILAILAAPGAPAWGQTDSNIYLDFDDDGSPWTIRTALPEGVLSGTVKFILEVNSLPLPINAVEGMVTEGCCDGPNFDGHYGTAVDALSVTFDPTYVANFVLGFPTCTFCCPWLLDITLNSAAPVAVGQRYFIGQAQWNAYCDVSGPCVPPTEFSASFSGIGGVSNMFFTCPPTASDFSSWGRIKSLYR